MRSPEAQITMLDLSQELIDHIIDHLDDRDVFTIKGCSLVSRAFARRSRARLFAYIRRKVIPDENEHLLEECLRASAAMRGKLHVLCAADLVQNIELCGDYLRPAPRMTTGTLRRILSYVPRLRRFQLHNFCMDRDEDSECDPPLGRARLELEELDLRLDFRTTVGLIRVLRLFSRTTCLRLRQIVSREAADFPQAQDEVEAEIARVTEECPLDLCVTQLELYLWQIGPVCLELLKRAAYKSGVAVRDVRIRCDSGQRNFELLGAFFSDQKISACVHHVTMVYPFYVPGPLPDFSALQLRSLKGLASLTIEGFYLGEVRGPQAPFALIPQLLLSWSSLPPSSFRLNLDIVFSRRLSSCIDSFPRNPIVDTTSFLECSMDSQWDEIQTILEKAQFPQVAFRLTSQEGALQVDEKVRLMDTIHSKLYRLYRRDMLIVEVTEPRDWTPL